MSTWISFSDARAAGPPGSSRSNSLVTRRWKVAMKKTALLKLGHVETMTGNVDEQDVCIRMISIDIKLYIYVKTLPWPVQLLHSVFSLLAPSLHCKKMSTGEIWMLFVIEWFNSHFISPLEKLVVVPHFLWILNAVNCAMHARSLKTLEKIHKLSFFFFFFFFFSKTNKVLVCYTLNTTAFNGETDYFNVCLFFLLQEHTTQYTGKNLGSCSFYRSEHFMASRW